MESIILYALIGFSLLLNVLLYLVISTIHAKLDDKISKIVSGIWYMLKQDVLKREKYNLPCFSEYISNSENRIARLLDYHIDDLIKNKLLLDHLNLEIKEEPSKTIIVKKKVKK